MTLEEVQKGLKLLGLYDGKVDNDFGPLTRSAIKRFQAQRGLSVTGIPTPATQVALAEILERRRPSPEDPKDPQPPPAPKGQPPLVGKPPQIAVAIMTRFLRDFPGLDVQGAAAMAGNFWYESGGFNPKAIGPGGDFGLPQWMGSRKKGFFTFCSARGYSKHSIDAQYEYILHELKTSHRSAIGAVKRPGTLMQKVKWFELIYEVAGVKAYAERYDRAVKSLHAYNSAH